MVTTKKYNQGIITYALKRQERVNGIKACVSYSGITANAATVTRTFEESESRTHTRGDHVRALPFTGQYIEQSPVAGSIDTTYLAYSSGDPLCGPEAGTTYRHTSDIGAFVVQPMASVPVFNSTHQYLADSADTKALADVNRSYYSAGVILAERLRTIDYITGKSKQLAALLRARTKKDLTRYLQSRKTDRKRIAKDLAGEHLGFVFGLLPLINEIKGMADLLASSETLIITGRGRHALLEETTNGSQVLRHGASSTYWPCCINVSHLTTVKRSVRTSVSMKVDVVAFQKMRDHGFNPIATFYDLVPLSFLSDFISNTGTFLRSYDPTIGLSFLTGSRTHWAEQRITSVYTGAKWTYAADGVTNIRSAGAGEGFSRALSIKRVPLLQPPQPVLMFQNNLSLAKAATIASLAIQRAIKPVRAIKALRDFRYRGPRPKYLPPIKYKKVK